MMRYIVLFLLLTKGVNAQDTINVKKEAEGEVYTIVETMPEPPGGISAFYRYIASNIVYPALAREKGLEGKCFLKFVVNSEGTMEDVQVIKGVAGCPECDAEALRVIQSYPDKWKPGSQNGKPVSVYYNIPVNFKIQNLHAGARVVETAPQPPGGSENFYQEIKQQVQYPASAAIKKITGEVQVRFAVETDGSLSDFAVMRGIPGCAECDAEAVRVLEAYSKKWQPGTRNGKVERMYYTMSVYFKPQQ